ncbi:Multicopper oxidase [Aspergillus sp. HF37]|nr:Multicopper oxidase [Aspergillus sp. HF37]
MERQSSRRRKGAPPRDNLQEMQSRKEPEPEPEPEPKHSRPRFTGTIVYPLIVCLLIILAYLRQSNTSGPLQSLAPYRIRPGRPTWHDSDSLRPRIQLHPEDHVYRQPSTQHLDWRVTSDFLRPDGVLKRVYLVNGLFPGPTIEARSGDTLVVNVTNALEDKEISIHWHGLHIRNSMDGTSGVTQAAISPGDAFVYNFTIPADQSETFWYHAHSGVHRADGMYGGLIVHQPAPKSTVRGLVARESAGYNYDKELLLLVGDWYHRPADQVLAWYMRAGSFGNEPVPDSLLVNGVGSFDCAMAVPARPVDCIESQADSSYIDLDRSLDYRIRVVNTGSLAGFTLAFEREQLRLIQLDSNDVEPQDMEANSAGILYPGQRMDFILRSPEGYDRLSSMTVELDPECFKYPNPALNSLQTVPINKAPDQDTTGNVSTPSTTNSLDLTQVASSSTILATLPKKAQQTHVVYTKVQKLSINENVPFGFFNMTSWRPQAGTPLISLPRDRWDNNQFSLSTGQGPVPAWVDLVVNNLDEGPHPFHLHGHHFFILAIHQASVGWGSYNPFAAGEHLGSEDEKQLPVYNLSRAILRDTVEIPTRGHAVLRFHADNPGVWLFHCHILWHLASGMAMLVDVMR